MVRSALDSRARWWAAGLLACFVACAVAGIWSGATLESPVGLSTIGLTAAASILGGLLLRGRAAFTPAARMHTAIVDTLSEGVIAYTNQGVVEFVNRSAHSLVGDRASSFFTGGTEDGLVDAHGRPLPTEGRAPHRANLTRQPVLGQIVGLQRPGEACTWLRLDAVPIEGNGVVMSLCDLTGARRSSEALHDSEERFRGLLENIREGVVIHRGFDVIYRNEACARQFGAQSADSLACIFPSSSRADFERGFAAALSEGRASRHRQVRLEGGLESEIWVDMSTRPIVWNDGPALETLLLDVTDQVRAQRAAQAKLEAEEEARAKSQMLANMSHELRTPMTGVLGMTELLLQAPSTPGQKSLLEGLRASADLLLTLLDDVLDFSKLEAGALRLESIDFDLRQAVQTVVHLLEPRAKKKALDLRVRVDDASPQAVRGDPARLQQILFNLVGNALKFTDAGFVEIRVQSTVKDGVASLRFEVEDTGIGVDTEQIPHLFRRFEQGDPSTNRRFGGSGLGLAICKQLTEIMGGNIGIDSQAGAGSTFFFTVDLPVGDSSQVHRAEVRDSHPSLGWAKGLKLLLAEDQEVNRLMLRMLMEGDGFEVVAVENGAEAVVAAEAQSFDIILMDMHMPVMSGGEAVRRIRRLDNASARAVIVGLTADALMPRQQGDASVGLDTFLTKPFHRDQFALLARDLLRAHTPSSPDEAEPLIALPRLQHLMRSLGRDKLDRLLERLPDQVRAEVESLEAAVMAKAPNLVAERAHRLAGLAGNFGAEALSSAARGFENEDWTPTRDQRLAQLHSTLERTIHALEQTSGQLQPDPHTT